MIKAVLFVAFAFTIMADPISSVAYTIEASLRALRGHLGLLMATQLIVLAIILLVDLNYWQLVARFPLGSGSAEAAARAFGTGWVFVPIGALIVDFILTITISVAAAVSALISYVPSLARYGSCSGYGLFQATSTLLLLAAASSSFQAGPGPLKALSRSPAACTRYGSGQEDQQAYRRSNATSMTTMRRDLATMPTPLTGPAPDPDQAASDAVKG